MTRSHENDLNGSYRVVSSKSPHHRPRADRRDAMDRKRWSNAARPGALSRSREIRKSRESNLNRTALNTATLRNELRCRNLQALPVTLFEKCGNLRISILGHD